jgi:hypothetical protein
LLATSSYVVTDAEPLPVATPFVNVMVPEAEQMGGAVGLVMLDEVSVQEPSVTVPV